MKTKEQNPNAEQLHKNFLRAVSLSLGIAAILFFGTQPAFAHCDSYDGPVIKDAVKALETSNANLVLKWVSREQEKEITDLFNKTLSLQNGDREIYSIVQKHFFETLVRLHRETEGAPYTGLKPAGTAKEINRMSDRAIEKQDIDTLIGQLNNHIKNEITGKYHQVELLYKVKDNSVKEGRAYVEAYVDYTHSLEALHDVLAHGGEHNR